MQLQQAILEIPENLEAAFAINDALTAVKAEIQLSFWQALLKELASALPLRSYVCSKPTSGQETQHNSAVFSSVSSHMVRSTGRQSLALRHCATHRPLTAPAQDTSWSPAKANGWRRFATHARAMLALHDGNKTQCAKTLGISVNTLKRQLLDQ